MSTQANFSRQAHRSAEEGRAIQSQVDKADGAKASYITGEILPIVGGY